MQDKKYVAFTIRVLPSLDDEIRHRCYEENISKAELARKAIRYYLENTTKEN